MKFPAMSHGRARRAFTMVELLVVIGIIGVLSGVILAGFSGSTESARAARCLSNMKNLASACQAYGMNTGRYPNAGSVELMAMDTSQGKRRVQTKYTERQGWISWDSKDGYPSQSHRQNGTIGMYSNDKEQSLYALTNGCLWSYVSRNRQTYVCPSHSKKKGKDNQPLWSYLMNCYFGWDTTEGSGAFTASGGNHTEYGRLARADRYLLFSEVPFMGYSQWQPDGSGGTEDTDAILKCSTSGLSESSKKGANMAKSGNETIGANHIVGKNLLAHVAFADGHVEKLHIPYSGSIKAPKADDTQLQQLTAWLCNGIDVSYDGKRYQKMDEQ